MSSVNLQHYQLWLLFPVLLSNTTDKAFALLSLKLPFQLWGPRADSSLLFARPSKSSSLSLSSPGLLLLALDHPDAPPVEPHQFLPTPLELGSPGDMFASSRSPLTPDVRYVAYSPLPALALAIGCRNMTHVLSCHLVWKQPWSEQLVFAGAGWHCPYPHCLYHPSPTFSEGHKDPVNQHRLQVLSNKAIPKKIRLPLNQNQSQQISKHFQFSL